MKFFYKIDTNNEVSLGSGTVVPKGFKTYTRGKEPKALLSLLNKEKFSQAVAAKIEAINTSCAAQITGGFDSSAIGGVRRYRSTQIDQLNLIGVVTGGMDAYFKCATGNAAAQVWAYELHTIAQLKQVLNDGKAFKQTLLQKAKRLKDSVKSAKTQADLDLIVW